MQPEILDVLIIGAGVSGIGVACTLARELPEQRLAIVERRARLGGTWDLFRYPGIRSDSDMHSYAYAFRPWRSPRILGDAASIRGYLDETAREHGVLAKIRYGLHTRAAAWSSAEQRWTVRATDETTGTERVFRARFLVLGTGYYDPDAGYTPALPGIERFAGPVVHPQHWPDDLQVEGKRVLVIGSGATAVSLVPALAKSGADVTMLQRSPTFLLSLPSEDPLARLLGPRPGVFRWSRAIMIGFANAVYRATRLWPEAMRSLLVGRVRRELAGHADPADFEPRHQPWDERLCVVSDGDLFEAIRSGQARVVTDHIARFEADRVVLRSGRMLEADLVVTATGLTLRALGGVAIAVDGAPYDFREHLLYRSFLLEGAPNLAWIFGYINASWTLKVDLVSAYLCRLLRYMDERQLASAVPRARPGSEAEGEHILDVLKAGYVQRSGRELPRQGRAVPWRMTHDYDADRRMLLHDPIGDGLLHFERARPVGAIREGQASESG